MPRDMIFVSHANPEDNEFARWLSLQLAREGYPVWCDVVKLLGGEDFWRDIEDAIRNRTVKFLYVVSRSSNDKEGPLNELHLALNVKRDCGLQDFVIPLHIDDLPYREINVQLGRLNAIPFEQGWATGLGQLLDKLKEDGVPKDERFNPDAVSSWWRDVYCGEARILDVPEAYISNWLEITKLPRMLYFHEMVRAGIGRLEMPSGIPFPAVQHLQYIATFAPSDDIAGALPPDIRLQNSRSCGVDEFIAGTGEDLRLDPRVARDILTRLLREAWEKFARARDLFSYEMANKGKCFCFGDGLLERNLISYQGIDGTRTWRAMVGYKTLNTGGKRLWHFGVEAVPQMNPVLGYAMKSHVVFTKDGVLLGASEQHAARRSQCRTWWNAEWRDRLLAVMAWLAKDGGELDLAVSSDDSISISAKPLEFNSPVSYLEPAEILMESPEDDELEDE